MYISLLDGGMGQELIKRSGQPASPLWSTQVMIDHPGMVSAVHADYADAGASVATTNSYALHRDRLRGGASNHYAANGFDLPNREGEIHDLLHLALSEAQHVRARSRVAGSIGPLGASYRSDINPARETAVALYAEIARALAPQVDVLLFETIASLEAAHACLEAGRQTDLPVWLAFTVSDEDGAYLRSGEPVAQAAAVAAQADAALINCSVPETIPAALEQISRAGVPFGAYANGFEKITQAFINGGTTSDGLSPRALLDPATYARCAMGWVEQGATIVGGCCEIGPAHIAHLYQCLRESGYSIV